MQVMGLDNEVINDIIAVVAGILHLGNISFVERGNYAIPEDDGCMWGGYYGDVIMRLCSFTVSSISTGS